MLPLTSQRPINLHFVQNTDIFQIQNKTQQAKTINKMEAETTHNH